MTSCFLCVLFVLVGACEQSPAAPGTDRRDHPDHPLDSLAITLGSEEMVIRYRTDVCGDEDLPDVYARALRSPDGRLLMVAGNAPVNHLSAGAGFGDLARVCDPPALVAEDDPDAASFRNQEWLAALYREGEVIHALVHNEYHDPVAPQCKPGDTSPANPCWYNAITYAFSVDGGRTFQRPDSPAHVIAAPPIRWDPGDPGRAPGPQGYFEPSNPVRGPDGYLYVAFFAIPDPDRPTHRGTCLMRTLTPGDPASWRAWDGGEFTIRMGSPYVDGASDGRECVFLAPQVIGALRGSLTWNAHLEQFVLVGSGARHLPGGLTCGFFLAVSEDLLDWSPPQLLREGPLPHSPCQATPGSPHGAEIYPTLIDHASPSLSFEETGRTPHLYFVRWNAGLDRDLIRVPLTLERP